MISLDSSGFLLLVKQKPHAIPCPAKNIRRADGFERYQRMFNHLLPFEHKLHCANFLTRSNRSEKWLLIFHPGLELVSLMAGKRKINIISESRPEFVLGAFP